MIQTEINIDKMINNYKSFTSNLLASIESVTAVLGDKQFVNSLCEVQKQLGLEVLLQSKAAHERELALNEKLSVIASS